MKKKIGIMGGTFNPIHIGHLILSEYAYEQFALDEVMIMPSKNPPHKNKKEIVEDYHRVNMILEAIATNNRLKLSTIELEREGITYTADTIKQLIEENSNTEYYFIVGADSLFQLMTWHKPEEIIRNVKIVAAVRYNISIDEMKSQCNLLNKKYNGNIEFLDAPNIDISSKMIRSKLSSGKSIRYMVAEKVYDYIYENGLYRNTSET